jgi:hypothetical protein
MNVSSFRIGAAGVNEASDLHIPQRRVIEQDRRGLKKGDVLSHDAVSAVSRWNDFEKRRIYDADFTETGGIGFVRLLLPVPELIEKDLQLRVPLRFVSFLCVR